ncbi:MAG: glycogen/starch synthase [Patescibacteria group bacterium]
MNILFAASEVAQISQLGGLGDVVSALPNQLHTLGITTRIVIPFTTSIDFKRYQLKKKLEYSVSMAGLEEHVTVWKTDYLRVVPVYILENRRYFYSPIMYRDFNGFLEAARYAFFSKAVLELIPQWDFQPDVIHTHDFYTGLIALFRNTIYKDHPVIGKIATILTIHSIRAQGQVSDSILDFAEIAKKDLTTYRKNQGGDINLVEQEILNADMLTTVSPTYARELSISQNAYGLENTIKSKKKDFYGILNGIDVHEYDPRKENDLYHSYGTSNVFDIKPKNKEKLLRHFKLQHRMDQPVISMITRLDDQKGIDLLLEAFPKFMEMDVTFFLLGQGRLDYVKSFKEMAKRYSDRMKAIFTFEHPLSKLIYAGSDILLMPSKFEPCGLTDMIAMRYGTLPLVHLVGGLKDAVRDEYNGFGFVEFNQEALLSTIARAVNLYSDYQNLRKLRRVRESKWAGMILHAMHKDVSWKKSARQYRTIYRKAIEKRQSLKNNV